MSDMENVAQLASEHVQFIAPDPSSFIVGCSIISILWASYQYKIIAETTLDDCIIDSSTHAERTALKDPGSGPSSARQLEVLKEVYEAVRLGANSFLKAEYTICLQFVVGFSGLILCLIGWYVKFWRKTSPEKCES
jgi:hypothetical protein